MSRLTGTDAYGLMEAYSAVYAPQELTEEQVWEEVENWVNALIEEGYDLSEYTWEEMYESYLKEQGSRGSSTASQTNQSVNIPNPLSAISNFFKGSGGAGTTGGSQTNTRGGGSSRPPIRPQLGNLPSSARQVTQYPKGVPTGVGGGNAGASRQPVPTPAAKPTAGAPTRPSPAPAPAKPTGGNASVSPTKPTTPAAATPSAPRQKDTSITDMIGRSQVRQGAAVNTGNASSDARAIAARSSVGATPTPSAATPAATPKRDFRNARERMINSSFDPFDVVIGHLIDEGYANTEEAALAIMANMSEEWRQSIVEGEEDYRPLPRRKMLNKANQLRKSGDVNKRAKSADIEYQLRAHSPEASKTSSYVNRAYGRGSDS